MQLLSLFVFTVCYFSLCISASFFMIIIGAVTHGILLSIISFVMYAVIFYDQHRLLKMQKKLRKKILSDEH